ncbi:hypothetical protein [Brevibacillus massiliensis]|uniref:hypothetical protein n=1 Tax=Brevibacillus massiliensis TaxID=1118054 RepID=UPI000372A273|nr:hypothetical protein [Brevibacillus massiliensis]
MKCQYPDCRQPATKSWALVTLCESHHETIREETIMFYTRRDSNRSEVERRPHYMEISELVPWSKVNMRAGDW